MVFCKAGNTVTGVIVATGTLKPSETLEKHADTNPKTIESRIDWKENPPTKDAVKP